MKRGYEIRSGARSGTAVTAQRTATSTETSTSESPLPDDRSTDPGERDAGTTAPRGSFDARVVRELLKTASADPKGLRRTIRRTELRQIVPLADSTIYEMERRGEFPQRFFLTPRCVVWDLAEVMAWLESRRRGDEGGVKKAPGPDYRLRQLPVK
jgi:prophage regulatory protein